MDGGGGGSGAMLSACFLLCGLYSVLSGGVRDGGGGSVGPCHIWCFGCGGLGMVAGVCWFRSYLVLWLWGSRDGGGGLLVHVLFGVSAVGV